MNFIARKTERGAALITSLLIVLVISILGVAVGQQVIALRKISSANYDYTLSINHAESALSEVHSVIISNYLSPDVVQALSVNLNTANNWWRDDVNWASAAVLTVASEGLPTYLIEDAGVDAGMAAGQPQNVTRHFYRVTARANGRGESVAFLQSFYATLE